MSYSEEIEWAVSQLNTSRKMEVFLKIGRGETLTTKDRRINIPSSLYYTLSTNRRVLTPFGLSVFHSLTTEVIGVYNNCEILKYQGEGDSQFDGFLNWVRDTLPNLDVDEPSMKNALYLAFQAGIHEGASNPYC